jgi:hypothetical protein
MIRAGCVRGPDNKEPDKCAVTVYSVVDSMQLDSLEYCMHACNNITESTRMKEYLQRQENLPEASENVIRILR